MEDTSVGQNGDNGRRDLGNGKSQIFLNAFDMFTIGHLSPGQWKVQKLAFKQEIEVQQ